METEIKRRRNHRLLIFLTLVIIGAFIGLMMISSARGVAWAELKKCETELEVQHVWEAYSGELGNDEEFILEVKKKLTSFDLPQEKILACLTWFPVSNEYTNIIVIPDLSQRIADVENYPGQTERDTEILRTIWKEFIELTGNQSSKNQLIFALTDGSRMNGAIQDKIQNLFVCLDGEENTPQHTFFTPYRTTKFNKNCRELYELAEAEPITADFYTLVKSNLQSYIKPSNFYDKYVNKIIILTNGKIDTDSGGGMTEISAFENEFSAAANKDSILKCITKNGLNLKPIDVDWSDTEILICEINGGRNGKPFFSEVLSVYWEDWFNKMGCKVTVSQGNLPPKLICNSVRDFIQK